MKNLIRKGLLGTIKVVRHLPGCPERAVIIDGSGCPSCERIEEAVPARTALEQIFRIVKPDHTQEDIDRAVRKHKADLN